MWSIAGLCLVVIILLHIPPFQAFLGGKVADAMASKFGTKVELGRVDLGFLNRLIVDDVTMLDQMGDTLLRASRLSVKIDFIPLTQGRISISSAQLFGLKANLYKTNAESKPNFQFVLDSLASKGQSSHTPLDLHIGSVIIRNGTVRYNQLDASPSDLAKHISLYDISSHIIINKLTDDLADVSLKKLSFKEKSGLEVNGLKLKARIDDHHAVLSDFELRLPNTDLTLGDINATYKLKHPKDKKHVSLGDIDMKALKFKGSIEQSKVTLSDLKSIVSALRTMDDPIFLNTRFSGTGTSLHVEKVSLRAANGDVNLQAKGAVSHLDATPHWTADIDNLNFSAQGIRLVADNLGTRLNIPKEITRLGAFNFHGSAGGKGDNIYTREVLTTDAGKANLIATKSKRSFQAKVETEGIDLQRILADKKFGIIATKIDVSGIIPDKHHKNDMQLSAKGTISRFDYNNYIYHNITIDGNLRKGIIDGIASIKDPNIDINVKGNYNLKKKLYDIQGGINHLSPHSVLAMNLPDNSYNIDGIHIDASNYGHNSHLNIEAPFANLHLSGQYDYTTLSQSITNMIGSKLPTLPGLPKMDHSANNNFTMYGELQDAVALQKMFGIDLRISQPVQLSGTINDRNRRISLTASLPAFSYNGTEFRDGYLVLTSPNDSLKAYAHVKQEQGPYYRIDAKAADNKLFTLLTYNNNSQKLPINGQFDTETDFFKNQRGQSAAHVNIHKSDFHIGDSIWEIQPSDIIYSKNRLLFDHFEVAHNNQHVIVSGLATPSNRDSLLVDLRDVDVNYILNLVNFHSVDFGGKVSGTACVRSAFRNPDAYAQLLVNNFTFENGEMGTLHARVNWNKEKERIDLKSTADDGPGQQTTVNGYIAPKADDILLDIGANGTPLYFLKQFCGSFMDRIEARGYGMVHLIGPLSHPNLKGDITAKGSCHLSVLNTEYTFDNLHAHAEPNEIILTGDTVRDRNNNIGIVNFNLHHKALTHLTYDADIKAHNLLCYDFRDFGDDTFCGTVYATGNCRIKGISGQTTIDIDATPEKNTVFTYNAASPAAISDQSFIHWHDITPDPTDDSLLLHRQALPQEPQEIPSDMFINFKINANPNLTLKVLMDQETGDFIALNGEGEIKASYFNKGDFKMYGNYIVDHGSYTLTIQNVIKKIFQFEKGGTISFGGDPYNAPLNLKAKYTVSGVSLSDLNIGRSFSSNNIRVDCFMDITGTPKTPKIDFSMDMPTVNSDARQMIYSLINSNEEMNQQVLYLLAVGRFMAQSNNNQSPDNSQQSQTSLAMQSLLSGTISQQLNNVLSTVIKNTNWNFGANISTGDEGFNNAEYEGTLSGRLLNNRLLFNGQFGYRDNANTTTSFIGDFDLRYLLFPNGNFAVRVYNQTNDRYFTKSSLNTQGIGIIMQKDFNGLRDLFGTKHKKVKTEKKKKNASRK